MTKSELKQLPTVKLYMKLARRYETIVLLYGDNCRKCIDGNVGNCVLCPIDGELSYLKSSVNYIHNCIKKELNYEL